MTIARIIGGMFPLQEPVPPSGGIQVPGFIDRPHVKLASARSAFRLLDRIHAPGKVWLPAYLCEVIVDAILPPRERVHFYPVTGNLELAERAWLELVSPGDLVVFITFFGFDTWSELGDAARRRGAIVVEDAAQAMLGSTPPSAHYSIISPRKFVGVPDGGVLVSHFGSKVPIDELPAPDTDWWTKAFRASLLRRDFDAGSGDREWYELFNQTEPNAPIEPNRMSELSAALLGHCVDYAEVADRRRANFSFLLEALGEFAVFRSLPDGVVPLGFPVKFQRRDEIRQRLFVQNIYPPVHWPVGRVVPKGFAESHQLEKTIMTLPCDQRYSFADMQRMVDVIKSAFL